MGNKDNFEVALTKCFFCGGDDKIIMNSVLVEGAAASVRECHKKVIDMDPCNKCKEFMKLGIILITIDPEKSVKGWEKPPSHLSDKERQSWMPNPFRAGGFFVVRDDFVRRAFQPPEMADWAIKHRWMFMEDEVAKMLGLYKAQPTGIPVEEIAAPTAAATEDREDE